MFGCTANMMNSWGGGGEGEIKWLMVSGIRAPDRNTALVESDEAEIDSMLCLSQTRLAWISRHVHSIQISTWCPGNYPEELPSPKIVSSPSFKIHVLSILSFQLSLRDDSVLITWHAMDINFPLQISQVNLYLWLIGYLVTDFLGAAW